MIHIRKINSKDWEVLKSIRLCALQESPSAFDESYDSCVNMDESFWKERATSTSTKAVFIAFNDTHPVGNTACFIVNNIFHLAGMWVAVEFRRNNIASHLLKNVIDFAKSINWTRIYLWVTVGNIPANSFYTKMGFKYEGIFKDLESINGYKTQRMYKDII